MFEPNCETCINSRLVVSENGYHYQCCLSGIKSLRCHSGNTSYYEGKSEVKADE